MRGRRRMLLWTAGAIVGVAAEWAGYAWDRPDRWLPDLITGWALIGCGLCGLVGAARQPRRTPDGC